RAYEPVHDLAGDREQVLRPASLRCRPFFLVLSASPHPLPVPAPTTGGGLISSHFVQCGITATRQQFLTSAAGLSKDHRGLVAKRRKAQRHAVPKIIISN